MVSNSCPRPTGNYVWDIPIPLLYTSSTVVGVSIIREFLGLFWQPLSCPIILLLGPLSSSLISLRLKTSKAKQTRKQIKTPNKHLKSQHNNFIYFLCFSHFLKYLVQEIPSYSVLEEGITTALLYLEKFCPWGKCIVSRILLTQTDSQSNCREKYSISNFEKEDEARM